MRNKFRAAAAVLLALIALAGCGKKSQVFSVYYKNADGDSLVMEEHKTSDLPGDRDKTVEYLIGELSKSPRTEGLINVLPDGTRLLGVSFLGRTATVNLSKEYYQNTDVDELLARYAIVSTLGEIDGVDNVSILIEGEPLVSATSGAEVGRISKTDVVYSPLDKVQDAVDTLRLYFPDTDGQYLVPEEREIEMQSSLSTERLILSELMKGPDSKNLTQAVPADIKVISAETKDGVCFVNMSGDVVEKISPGTTSTTLFLYSIVNSLTELETIDSVQLLIDGKTGVEFGNYVLDAPLEKNSTLIKE